MSTVTKFIRKSSFIVALALHLAAVSIANAQVVPDKPKNLAAANHSSTTFAKVVLTWDTPDNTGDSPITHVCYQYRRYHLTPPPSYWTNYSQRSCVPVSNVNEIVTGNLQAGALHEFDVALQNSAGLSNWAVVFFTPGFSPTLAIQPTSVAENAAATVVTVTVTLGKRGTLTNDTPVTVSVGEGTATAGTDYTAIEDFLVTVPGGKLTVTGKFTLTPVDDNMVEGDETINISGTAANFRFADASLTIVDDDKPPVFASEQLTRQIAENTAANTNVGEAIPAATDANNDPLTYTMEGTDASSFTFDASSRQIKTKQGVTYDHESKPSYSVTIRVSDGTASDTVDVTINIADVNEPPSKPAAPTVSGASTTSLSVSWSAPTNTGKPDITGYHLRYRAGTSGDWSEGPQNVTGTSTTISSLNSGTSYQVQVRATNAEGESPWSDSGSASTNTPANSAPSFNDSSLTRSVAENTAANNNVGEAIPAATDADASDTLIYTMEGTDASSFTFDASSRQIKTKQGVTYDHESKPSYSVTIRVSDGTASDTVDVTINIADVNEPPSKPAAPTVSGASTTSLSVSWSAPTNTGKPDITGYHLRYRAGTSGDWSEGPQNVTGTSTTISSLNSGTSYQVQVRATNAEGESPWSDSGSASTNTDVLVSLSVSPNPVMEGSSVTVTTVLSEAASSDMMVPLTVTQGSSEDGDHGTLSSTMIPEEHVSATGTIATNQDTDSDDETFTVALGAPLPPGCVAGSPAKVTVRIVDDDWTNPFPGRPDDPAPSSPSCGESNREDLESFYETTDGDNWLENTNWKSEEPLRQWYGVETDEEENVVSLRLSHNGLSGEIPGEELLCLYHSELKELALWGNEDLSGEVPEELLLAVERAVLRDIAEMLDLNPKWFEDYEDPFLFEDWHSGVTTDDEERVTELDFTGEDDITGEIPESVFELQRLEKISTGCGITLEVEAPERVSVIMPDDCTEETVSSGGGGCALSSKDSSVFGLFLVTLLVFAELGRRRVR